MARISLVKAPMDLCRKRIIWSQNGRLLAFFVFVSIIFDSFCVYAKSEICTQVFGPNSHPFFQHLFGNDPAVSPRFFEENLSVAYAGHDKDRKQISFRRKYKRSWRSPLKKERMNWYSKENVYKLASTPQGDPRYFIYLAGQELAERFGFEFRIEGDDVVLLVPDAEKIESLVLQLNPILIARGKDPISYLPLRTGFVQLGEILNLSNSSISPIEIRFPYADLDPVLASHEVAYHLGALLFGNQIMKKANAIDQEYSRVIQVLQTSGLPKANEVMDRLKRIRESELDEGAANLQVILASARKYSFLRPFSSFSWHHIAAGVSAMASLAHPYYSPTEALVLELIHTLNLQGEFKHIPHFKRNMDHEIDLQENGISDIKLSGKQKAQYIQFIKNLLRSHDDNPLNQTVPARQNARLWLLEMQHGMEKRIKELLDAFDELGH